MHEPPLNDCFRLQVSLRIEERIRSKNTCHFETTIHIPIMFGFETQKKLSEKARSLMQSSSIY